MPTTVHCPQCGKPVLWQPSSTWKPFCSERCKMIDLGDWASENHRIAGEPAIDENINEEMLYPDNYH